MCSKSLYPSLKLVWFSFALIIVKFFAQTELDSCGVMNMCLDQFSKDKSQVPSTQGTKNVQNAAIGDCIFKNEKHACPSASPQSTSQGLCTAGRGHEPIGHKCKPLSPASPHMGSMPPVRIMNGETLDVSAQQAAEIRQDFKMKSARLLVIAGPNIRRSTGGRDLHQWRTGGLHTRGG